LVVTGGAVRLTGSGLGCPTWPECTPGSYTPVPHQAEGQLHAWIEFGNRLLTFALVIASIVVIATVLKNGRRDLRALALGQFLGIFAQGVLGGITVLTNLNPIPVAGHLLLSMVLISGATSLHAQRHLPFHRIENNNPLISRLHMILAFVVVILGTIVTGSGPHAGDLQAKRFGFQVPTVAWIHAYAVIALTMLTIVYFIKGTSANKKTIGSLGFVILIQGAIGFIQYYQGVPELLVGAHLLGASVFWVLAWRVWLSAIKRNG
jgi:cytochrome c oxidase assembly protein subunit 15